MPKKTTFTWRNKEFWIGWYEEKTYQQIGEPYVDLVYHWGVLNKIAIAFLAMTFFVVVATPIVALGYLLELFL